MKRAIKFGESNKFSNHSMFKNNDGVTDDYKRRVKLKSNFQCVMAGSMLEISDSNNFYCGSIYQFTLYI